MVRNLNASSLASCPTTGKIPAGRATCFPSKAILRSSILQKSEMFLSKTAVCPYQARAKPKRSVPMLNTCWWCFSDYFLKGEFSLSYWIGLKYQDKKGFFWIDGTPLGDYQPWATVDKGEIQPGVENCVAMNLYTAMALNASADVKKIIFLKKLKSCYVFYL